MRETDIEELNAKLAEREEQIVQMEKLFDIRMLEAAADREAMIKEAVTKEAQYKIGLKDKEECMQKLIDAQIDKTEAVLREMENIKENRDTLFEEKFKVEEVVD